MVRVGILSVAHMHAWGYSSGIIGNPGAELVLVWDDDADRGTRFAEAIGATFTASLEQVLQNCDAIIVTSENSSHIDHLEACHRAGKPVLCEKPIVACADHAERLQVLIDAGARIMVALPCRYSPAFLRLKERIALGEIGKILSVCATNRGRCPFGWFVEKEKSGGGSMIDHVVHVADLLRVMLGEEPIRVTGQTGHNLYGKDWEDTAMVTLDYADGTFATIDSSWCLPQDYKTWGDVTMNVVGENGVIELDMFIQSFESLLESRNSMVNLGFGSDLDRELVSDFLRFARGEIESPISAADGLAASRVALAAYASQPTSPVL